MTTTNVPFSGRGRLEQMVAELERQKASKLDFTLDGRTVMVGERGGKLALMPGADARSSEFVDGKGMAISDLALQQLGARMKPNVPSRFLSELAAMRTTRAADLLTGLIGDTAGRHFFRCLDGKVRAVLSDRYRVLDNYDLAFNALNVARDVGGEVLECSLSEKNMRIKFSTRGVFEQLRDAERNDRGGHAQVHVGAQGNRDLLNRLGIQPGDLPGGGGNETVSPLVTISNSETGHGGLGVKVGLLRWVCVNGAIIEDVACRVHLGETMAEGVFTEETQAADSRAIMLKCRDAIRAAFNPTVFRSMVEKANHAAAEVIHAPREAVNNVVAALDLGEGVKDDILAYFLKDYAQTRYGLAQAIGRKAQDLADGDDAAAFEAAAGKVINAKTLAAVR